MAENETEPSGRCLLSHAGKDCAGGGSYQTGSEEIFSGSVIVEPIDVMVIDRFKSKEQQKEWEEFLGRN